MMLTFQTSVGVVCVIAASLPRLASTTRARVLNAYAEAASNTNADCVFIGGELENLNYGTQVCLHWQVEQMDPHFDLTVSDDTYVLSRGQCSTFQCELSEPDHLTSNLLFQASASASDQ